MLSYALATDAAQVRCRFGALMYFPIGSKVEKYKGDYGGPGVVKNVFEIAPNVHRYVVAHRIEGGYGELLHIYSEGQLRSIR